MIVGLALAWAVILAGCWLGWQLLRQNGRLLVRIEALEERLNELEYGEPDAPAGLPVGSLAPGFDLPDLADGRKTLDEFRGRALLIIFFNPACGYCRDLAPKLREKTESRKQKAEMEGPSVLIISTGDAEMNREFFREHNLGCPVLLQKETEVATAYQANGTPSGYLISAEGKIASELAMGAEALLKLAEGGPHPQPLSDPTGEGGQGPGEGDRADRFSNRSLTRSKIKRDGLKAGTPAPDFRLPRLDGRGDLSLEEFRGRRVFLVFSSPHCGPCDALAPQLEKFHRKQFGTERPLTLTLSPRRGEGKPKRCRRGDGQQRRAKRKSSEGQGARTDLPRRAATAMGDFAPLRDVRHTHRVLDRRSGRDFTRRGRRRGADSGAHETVQRVSPMNPNQLRPAARRSKIFHFLC